MSESNTLSPGLRLWAALVTVVVPPLLWVVSFEKLAGALERGRPALRGDFSRQFEDADLASFVDGILYRIGGPWRYTCLKRSAALFYLLRSAGRPVELIIGVRRDDAGRLQAHSWLSLSGALYLEPHPDVPPRHEVIARFPGEASGA